MSRSSPLLPLDLARLVDAACDRFEEGCGAGQSPRVEDYLAEVPPEARPALLRELLRLQSDCRGGPSPTGTAVTLTVTAGRQAGRGFTFDRHDTFVVGRADDVHFSLPDDPYFSRAHFLIEVNPPLCRLTDLRSKNGVLVNGAKVTGMTDLHDGDIIRGGKTELKVSIVGPSTPATVTLSGTPPETWDWPAPAPTPQADGPLTLTVPGYRLLRLLGEGGMGAVHLVEKETDGSRIALKTIRPERAPDERDLQRFERETSILRQLRHPHIVAYLDSGVADGQLWFAMEYVEGSDAGALVRQQGPLPVERAVHLVCHMLDALAHAHALGFVHRDVKPSNILVTGRDGQELAKLADFGLARAYQESALSGLTLAGRAGGTPGFMPPEQILDFRTVKPAADQYAAAATLYFLLTGEYPHGTCRGIDELFQKVLTADPVPLTVRRPDVPAALAAAVMRGLARKAEARFADVAEMRAVIGAFTSA